MEAWLGIVVGLLYAGGLYLMMRRSLVKLIFGLALLGHAANLLIFASGGLAAGAPPLVAPDASALPSGAADPVPQALILTAIVIGFGVQAFALVLLRRAWAAIGADDLDSLRATERDAGEDA